MGKIDRRRALSLIGGAAGAIGIGALTGCGASSSTTSNDPPPTQPPPPSGTYDVVIVGATPSGMMAARAALREGARICVIEPFPHVGGVFTSGLGLTDCHHYEMLGGAVNQFFLDMGAYYGMKPGTLQVTFEPHAAEHVFLGYLDNSLTTLILNKRLQSVSVKNNRIVSVTLADNTTIKGSQWIDASYEGDLMALSGVSYTFGREAQTAYNESLAGWGSDSPVPIDPVFNSGYIYPVHANPGEKIGQADAKIQAYTFRLCLSTDKSNFVPFTAPANYNPDRYEGARRWIQAGNFTTISGLIALGPNPNHKKVLENVGPFSTDYAIGCWNYPDGDWATRDAIWADCKSYVQGFMYYVTNDPSVPESIRTQMAGYGLPADEFTDNGNWPWQMYVREGRRMLGQYVMTQLDVTENITKPDAIGCAQWDIDCHPVDLYAAPDGSGGQEVKVDSLSTLVTTPIYQVPFSALLPKTSQITNLAVSVCMSASHIAFCSLRVEPTYMVAGEAAGTAAAMAVSAGTDIGGITASELQAKLSRYGVVINIPS